MSIENCTDEELEVLHGCLLTTYLTLTLEDGESSALPIVNKWTQSIEQEIKDREFEKTKEL